MSGLARRGPQRLRARVETKRLVLRKADASDLELYCRRIYADPRVMGTLPGRRVLPLADALPRARANLIEHWDQHGFGPWLVSSRHDDRLLGHCGLRRWPHSVDVEVLYAIEPSSWAKGYATEAATATVQAGFAELGLERIIAGVLPANVASVRILRGLGLRAFEEREFSGLHVVMYELTRARWEAGDRGPGASRQSESGPVHR